MAIVETERDGALMVIRMNRPDRLNALGVEMRRALAEAWCEFRDSDDAEVAIFTGTGRAFCAGEDMKESVERGSVPGDTSSAPTNLRAGDERPRLVNPYDQRSIQKPVIAAINGFCMGGGFAIAEHADLRVAVAGAVFEMSEAKRWLLGGYAHGHAGNVPHTVATEMAFAFRFTAERMHQVGWLNRITEPETLMDEARSMAAHLLSLPPAARVNTLVMMRALRPQVPEALEELADRLRGHGALSDLMESRRAFAEKRAPNFKGWDDPADRYRTPSLESMQQEREGNA
ncbi:MAG: enoyl-CoA hydratase/isomerase family protein [Chloroflexi bacterium]|nr:enoyl-CoA hydratase/isomerase family protein [Chloroflexota bacterium]MDA1239686.1 enoyl-CoA hydratase/isomerase family protein [Chloroflexota bacterium]